MKEHYYYVDIRWTKERKGLLCSSQITSSDKAAACIEVATPPEFPKGMAGIWSPEHLFTASVASCFMTTFLAIAENSKLSFSEFMCKATGKLEESGGKYWMSEVLLEPEVTLSDESQFDRALRVLQRTETSCLITSSIKSTVLMKPVVKTDVVSANAKIRQN